MEQSPVSFPVWNLSWQDEEPHDEPHLDRARRVVAVTVHHGQPFAEGPGAIITSYNPRLMFVERHERAEGNHIGVLVRGPLTLGRAIAMRFADVVARQENRAPAEVADQMERLVRYPLQDAFIQCGNCLVPALEFGVGIPMAAVIVSADLLTHPVALGFWQWPVKVPVLEKVSFE